MGRHGIHGFNRPQAMADENRDVEIQRRGVVAHLGAGAHSRSPTQEYPMFNFESYQSIDRPLEQKSRDGATHG